MGRQVTPRDLRERITLQVRTDTPNALNEPVASWSTAYTVFAEATPRRARDFIAGGAEQLPVDVVFRIRYIDGVSAATHRVLWRSDVYAIHGDPIDIDGRKATLEIMGVKGLKHGN